MYPLNMKNAANGGHAVANTEDEHRSLTTHGYEPPFVDAAEAEGDQSELDQLRVRAMAAGVTFDKRWGAKKLREAIGQ